MVLASAVLVVCHLLWTHHQPTHPELVTSLLYGVLLCLLGTLLLLLDQGQCCTHVTTRVFYTCV